MSELFNRALHWQDVAEQIIDFGHFGVQCLLAGQHGDLKLLVVLLHAFTLTA